jgi:hypothetical protein
LLWPSGVTRISLQGQVIRRVIAVNAVGVVTIDPAQRLSGARVRRRMDGRALLVMVGLVIAAAARTGRADANAPAAPEPFAYQAPRGCPTAAELRARIEQRLGGPLAGTIHGIQIAIAREHGGFVAEIDARAITVENAVRTLRSQRCAALVDGIAVILARLATEAREQDAQRAPVRAAADGSHATEVADAPLTGFVDGRTAAGGDDGATKVRRGGGGRGAQATVGTWGGGVHLLGLSGVGALPAVNLGGELGGYVRRGDRFAQLAIGRWVPQPAYLQSGAPARVDVGLEVITLRAGWGPRDLPLRAWLTGELGQLRGTGVAVGAPRTADRRWTALGAGFGVAWPMAPQARLVGTVELAIPLERTRFMLESGSELYQPSAATARCAFGLEVGWR